MSTRPAIGVYAAHHSEPTGYFNIPSTATNALRQTPDDAPTINDLIITTRIQLNAVPGTGSRTICERWVVQGGGTNRFICRIDTTGKPTLLFQQSAATQTRTSTKVWPFAAGDWGWLRTTLDVDNGASGHTVTWETSTNGSSWSAFDSVVTAGVASVDAGSGALGIGNRYIGSALGLNGKMSYLKVANATTTLFEMNTQTDVYGKTDADTTFTSTSGHAVSVIRTGSPATELVPPPT